MSASAPSWICVLSVPEESKLKVTSAPVCLVKPSTLFWRLSVRLAAAKTVSLSLDPAVVVVAAAWEPFVSELPHAPSPAATPIAAMAAPNVAMASLLVIPFTLNPISGSHT